jgi:glutamine amidotransferase
MIVIIDYGLGNLGSIKNMLNKIGHDALITSDIEKISNASKLILPGVGSFGQGMKNLHERNLIPVLTEKVIETKTPILGICLGMQLFTSKSEEGTGEGLGWIDAETLKFDPSKSEQKCSIPHMGWEYVYQQKESRLLKDMYEDPKFYFVHSYYVKCHQPQDILLTSEYIQEFHSSFEKDNILGVQFHPEKSHKFGMKLLSNFITNY